MEALKPSSVVGDAVTRLHQKLEDPSIPYQNIVLGLSFGVFLFETYIKLRQIPHLKLKEPPASLAGYLTDPTQDPQAGTDGKAPSNGSASSPQEGFKASQAYALDKLKFSLFANAIDELETFLHASAVLAPLLGVRLRDGQAWSGYAWLWGAAGRLTEEWVQRTPHWLNWGRGEIPTSLSFIVLSSALELVTSIPADLYKQFVLEEKHGFNKQTLGLFIADQIKATALSALFGLPLIAALIKITRWAGEALVGYMMLFVFALVLVVYVAYPYLIAPLFNKFRHLSDFPEHNEVLARTHALAKKIGFPLGRLWVIDGSKRSSHSNAFFFGLPGLTKHIVLYDTLLKQATPEQIEAILAHELGHWKKRHTLLLLATSQVQIAFSLSIFRFFLWNPALFSSFGFSPLTSPSLLGKTLRWGSTDETYPIVVGFVLAHHLFNPLNAVLTFLVHSLSRALEYQADRFAKDLGYSAALKWALVRISVENKATTSFDWLYSAFHHSHPTLPERLGRLDAEEKKSQ